MASVSRAGGGPRTSAFGTSRGGLTTNGKVDNPYLTSAYASSSGGGRAGGGGFGDMGAGGMGGELYLSSKGKNNMQGKLKDTFKNTMAAAKQDNWKIVCVKATNHDVAAPKGKHVRIIMEGLRWGGSISNRESPAGGIYYHLRKRMAGSEWVVVVKAQTIFHHIFRDGNEKFVEYIASNNRAIFKMDFFSDSSPDGMSHMGFIKTYGTYIEQWLAMKAAVRFPPGKSKEDDPTITGCYRDASIEDLLAALPVIMDTVDALLDLQITGSTRYTPVATPAFTMILRDLTIFWITLQEGLIRLLELFFNLDAPTAVIALDVYKRFVALVANAQAFFENAKSLQAKWKAPDLGTISLELMDSMQDYIDNGPPDETPAEPQFSDEEEYEPEPEPEPEPVPEDYYEPEPEYYSEEEPEPLPPPRPRTPPPPSSSSSSSVVSSSSEESSEEDETDVLPSAPEPAPAPKPFDPLADLLGIDSGVGGSNGHAAASSSQQNMALQVYGAGGPMPGMFQPATLEHTAEDRVANVKGIMAAAGPANGQQQQRSGFGVDGTNMQMAMYGPPQNHNARQHQQQLQHHQQMYNSMAMQQHQHQQQQQQQQQHMAAYQTMAAYQSMAAANQQLALYQMQQQSMHNGMGGVQGMGAAPMNGMQRMGMMAQYTPVPQGNQSVPVMQAEGQQRQATDYRVQKGTKPARVNDDDTAFGPLLDQMKNSTLGK